MSKDSITFEIEWRNDRRGWHVLENQFNGARGWYPDLGHAVSFCQWDGAAYSGVIRITERDGSVRFVKIEGGGSLGPGG